MEISSKITIDSLSLPLRVDDQTKSSWLDPRGVCGSRDLTNTPVVTPMVRSTNVPSERGELTELFIKVKSVIRSGVFEVLGFNSQRVDSEFALGQKNVVLPVFSSPLSEGMIIRRLAEKSGVSSFTIPSTIKN